MPSSYDHGPHPYTGGEGMGFGGEVGDRMGCTVSVRQQCSALEWVRQVAKAWRSFRVQYKVRVFR